MRMAQDRAETFGFIAIFFSGCVKLTLLIRAIDSGTEAIQSPVSSHQMLVPI